MSDHEPKLSEASMRVFNAYGMEIRYTDFDTETQAPRAIRIQANHPKRGRLRMFYIEFEIVKGPKFKRLAEDAIDQLMRNIDGYGL